jgi:hypothetical protein
MRKGGMGTSKWTMSRHHALHLGWRASSWTTKHTIIARKGMEDATRKVAVRKGIKMQVGKQTSTRHRGRLDDTNTRISIKSKPKRSMTTRIYRA